MRTPLGGLGTAALWIAIFGGGVFSGRRACEDLELRERGEGGVVVSAQAVLGSWISERKVLRELDHRLGDLHADFFSDGRVSLRTTATGRSDEFDFGTFVAVGTSTDVRVVVVVHDPESGRPGPLVSVSSLLDRDALELDYLGGRVRMRRR